MRVRISYLVPVAAYFVTAASTIGVAQSAEAVGQTVSQGSAQSLAPDGANANKTHNHGRPLQDFFEEQFGQTYKSNSPESANLQLLPNALQIAQLLKVVDTIETLKNKQTEYEAKGDSETLLEIMLLRQKLTEAIQYASLELEEALANIEGDLSSTSLHLAYATAKNERTVLFTNVATFVGSGSFGILDTSSGIRNGPPLPNIFGIIGNSIATGLPLVSLRRATYENPRTLNIQGNMLAPIFGRPYGGAGYDPIIWDYIESVPAGSKRNLTRRQMLLETWRIYRGVNGIPSVSAGRGSATASGVPKGQYIDVLAGLQPREQKLSIDALKLRGELLVDVRALVQLMYRDISDLNSYVRSLK